MSVRKRRMPRTSALWGWLTAIVLCTQMQISHGAPAVTENTAVLPSGKVLYRDSGGGGIPIVFLHPSNTIMWEHQIPTFASGKYRFLAVDYRGEGGGGVGPADAAANRTRLEELVARLALPKFHLVGVAAGGVVAFQYALAHPERLRSLTISNSIGSLHDPQINAVEQSLRPAPFAELPSEVRNLSASYRAANPEGVKRWSELTGPAPPRLPNASTAPSPSAMANPDAVTWPRLAQFTVPTLMLTGDADLYTPPSLLRLFTARLRRAECAVVRESGHASYWENPEEFNRLVLAFIRKH